MARCPGLSESWQNDPPGGVTIAPAEVRSVRSDINSHADVDGWPGVDRRRVLLIAVGEFDAPPTDGEPDLSAPGFDPLDFAVERARNLGEVFQSYDHGGFEVTGLFNPDRHEISRAVDELLDDTAVKARILHVISHGRAGAQSDRVEVVARCGRPGRNNVREWVSAAQDHGVPTLFLVDLCGAGRAVDLRFSRAPDDGELKALVIAAAGAREAAYDGRFSELTEQVLRECRDNGLGMGAHLRYIPMEQFARRIADALKGQTLTSTSVQVHHRAELPFLPNPNWRPDPLAAQTAALNTALRPFLSDAIADAEHFRVRAGSHFTGRQSFLDEIVPWLDGDGEGGLWVVTGTAGAGKSAILGALVCAAHPDLSTLVPQVRIAMADPPAVNPLLAAVHARQRTLDELVGSIADQWHLTAPDTGWTASDLVTAVTAMPRPPVLILDALDECPQASAVQALLLLPLTYARRADGRAACRTMVGTRPWDQFRSVLDTAGRDGRLTDLDRTPPALLRRDLRRYLNSLLTGLPHQDLLATGVATRLAADHEQRMADPAATRWGQFLVASRYAQYLQSHPAADERAARRLAEQVPATLPDVLELELADHPARSSVRAALAALAFAKGEGMPREIAAVVARALGSTDPNVLTGEAARLYQRVGTEDSGASLYRLYHQGLADYLREHPNDRNRREEPADRVFEALIASRQAPDGTTSWAYAPPYLLRHAIHHAVDAGQTDLLLRQAEFLVHADPTTLITELDHASTEDGRMGAAVYRSSYHLFQDDPHWRRQLLHLTALRYGAHRLVKDLPWGNAS